MKVRFYGVIIAAVLCVADLSLFGNETGNPNLNYGPYPPSYMKYYNYLYSTNSLYYWRYLDSSLSVPNMVYTNSQISNMPWLKFYGNGMNSFNINNQPAFSPIIYNIQNPPTNRNQIKSNRNGAPGKTGKVKQRSFSVNPHFDDETIIFQNDNELQFHNSDVSFSGNGIDDYSPANFGNEF